MIKMVGLIKENFFLTSRYLIQKWNYFRLLEGFGKIATAQLAKMDRQTN